MPKTQTRDTSRIVAERRERDYDRYSQYVEHEKGLEARRDEITDMAERLVMPMESTFYYELRDEGLYSDYGTSLDGVVRDGYEDILRQVDSHPDWAFEVERRGLDVEELEATKKLKPGEKQVTFLPIPDAVREGKTSISGYNRQRMKMLVRVAERGVAKQSGRVSITSLSLDGSNYRALQAAAEAIGHDIPDGLTSEEIVANRAKMDASDEMDAKQVVETIRDSYDEELSRQYGSRWFSGIEAAKLQGDYNNAHEFVESQSGLVDQHMAFIKNLKARLSGVELSTALEDARYNLAAALDDKRKGKTVTSIGDSGSSAREMGMNYDGDCPTGSNSSTSTETQANSLGFKTETFVTNCPLCGEKGVTATRAGGMISCGTCKGSVDVCTGEVKKGRKPKKSLGGTAVQETVKPPARKLSKAEMIQAKYGSAITKRSEIVVGGKKEYFIHKQTGQRIDA